MTRALVPVVFVASSERCSGKRLFGAGWQQGKRLDRVGSATAYNFRTCDRDQAFLLLPDVRRPV
jgi:hypothetical protein